MRIVLKLKTESDPGRQKVNPRSKYKTKQRDILLDYLKNNEGKHICACDVCAYFKDRGAEIGQSTVYRHLESLVDEGLLTKYTIDANSPSCFEYLAPESHGDTEVCYHCKCEKCGKLVHLHCDEVKMLNEHLCEHHGFKMDPKRTVFYGLCEECMKKM